MLGGGAGKVDCFSYFVLSLPNSLWSDFSQKAMGESRALTNVGPVFQKLLRQLRRVQALPGLHLTRCPPPSPPIWG